MLKIDCTGLTLREGKELETYLKAQSGIAEVRLELDLSGMQHRGMQWMSAPHFHLLVHFAEGGGAALAIIAAKGGAEEFGKDVYKALKAWMDARFTDKSVVPVEVKLYGPDGRLMNNIEKRR